ncbi:hypothetical protein [Williamsia serinedens]|uniref:Holin n=1 Tax=Williamsia serinedens TaxID=391736 RepID=A0ABT1H7Q5_9NOCA|nr:hypothetical protein [Williamsia serinedens]MCP2162648.1 hypothetical protein [Williamsia serinedens]
MTTTKIAAFIRREPVAVALSTIIGALVVYGVTAGWLTADAAPIVLAVASLVLGVPVTAAVRSQVSPVAAVQTAVTDAARDALTRAVNNQAATPEVGDALNDVVRNVTAHFGRHRAES